MVLGVFISALKRIQKENKNDQNIDKLGTKNNFTNTAFLSVT